MSEPDKRILAIFALLALVIGIGAMAGADDPADKTTDKTTEETTCR